MILINKEKIKLTKKIHNIARNTEKNIKIIQCDYVEFLEIKDDLHDLVAIEITDSSKDVFNTRLPDPCSFVIGNERHGIPEKLLNLCHQSVHVPMYGINGSMNVIQVLAISLFEWRRQGNAVD